MLQIKKNHAVPRFDLGQKLRDVAGDLEKTFAGRADRQHRAGDRLDTRSPDGG
jgi:hypothetical protein